MLCYRAVNTKGAGKAAPPNFFGRSVDLIPTKGGKSYPPHYTQIFRPSYGPVLSDLSILRARITEICAAHKGSSHGIPRRPFSDHITKVRCGFFRPITCDNTKYHLPGEEFRMFEFLAAYDVIVWAPRMLLGTQTV